MSAAAVRASSTPPFIAPTPTKPRITSGALATRQARPASAQPTAPVANPPAITGTRPRRSMRRPAGSAASAPAVRKIAGPSPRIDSIPVTRTRVIVATATASWRTPESVTRHRLRKTVLRLICFELVTGRPIQPAPPEAAGRERPTRYDDASVTGSSGSRAERADECTADPQNLIWVMPAEEGVSGEIVVVVSGGEAPVVGAALAVPAGATVVAADRGLDHALALGFDVALAIGDFDSASPAAVETAERAGTRIERHPAEKDATD